MTIRTPMKSTIVDFRISLVEGFDQQHIRPFVGDDVVLPKSLFLDHIERVYDSLDDENRHPRAMLKLPDLYLDDAWSAIHPSKTVVQAADISGDWGRRRYAFSLLMETKNEFGGFFRERIRGYTDIDAIMPETTFYINSITRYHTITPLDNQPKIYSPGETVQVLRSSLDKTTAFERKMIGLRPVDVLAQISAKLMMGGDEFIDARTMIRGAGEFTPVLNQIPNQYLTKILDAMLSADQSRSFICSDFDVINEARALVTPSPQRFLKFYNTGADAQNYAQFTMSALEEIDLEAFSKIKNVEQTVAIEETGDSDVEESDARAAYSLGFVVSSIMKHHDVERADFTIRRDTRGGPITTDYRGGCVNLAFLSDIDPQFVSFAPFLERDDTFFINVTCDLMHSLVVSGWFDESRKQFAIRFPVFADGLYSPLLTNNNEDKVALADAIKKHIDHLFTERT